MAGPYEDPMTPRGAPSNPQGGGLPGQPRNPAAGGYPSQQYPNPFPRPMRPGDVPPARPDPGMVFGGPMGLDRWAWMMRQRGPYGGYQPTPGSFDPAPRDPTSPEQKRADLERYKRNVAGASRQGVIAANGGPMTDVYYDTSAPSWMDPARAAEIRGRVAGRNGFDSMPGDLGRLIGDPNNPLMFPGGSPTFDESGGGYGGLPPWARGGLRAPFSPWGMGTPVGMGKPFQGAPGIAGGGATSGKPGAPGQPPQDQVNRAVVPA